MTLILTDCDGVLLNWENSFIDWMTEQGFSADPNDNSYDMHKRFGERKAKIKQLVREFNNSAWIGFLKPHKDAVFGVSELVKRGYTKDRRDRHLQNTAADERIVFT